MRQGGGDGGRQGLVRPHFPGATALAERLGSEIHRRIADADRALLSALLFALEFRDGVSVLVAVAAMLLFTTTSGGHYVLNDVIDVSLDQQHPTKRNRPIAAGRLSRLTATGAAVFLILTATVLGFLLAWPLGVALTSYVLLQVMYTLWLKHIVVLDLLAISIGFVIRAAGGALAISVAISPWLYICTFVLALFLAVSKRWAELAGQLL